MCRPLTLPAVQSLPPHSLEKCRWSPPAVAAPFHHVSSYLLAVWHSIARGAIVRCCRMVTRYRYLTYRHPPRRRPCRFVLIRRTGGGEQGPPTESRTRIISSDFSPEVNLHGRFYSLSCPPFPISDKLIKMRGQKSKSEDGRSKEVTGKSGVRRRGKEGAVRAHFPKLNRGLWPPVPQKGGTRAKSNCCRVLAHTADRARLAW